MLITALILTEDGSKFAFDTLLHVCGKIFDVVVPRCEISNHVGFEKSSSALQAALSGNRWMSKKSRDYDKIITLCRAIATHVMRDDGFVFFHIDGDTTWGMPSNNVDKFEPCIAQRVRVYVRGNLEKRLGKASPAAVDHAMSKLVLLAPHYSIETWLFANAECLRGYVDPALHERVDGWAREPGVLDRTLETKTHAPTDTKHYPTLAAELAVSRLLALGTSFEDAVVRTGNCGALVVRLRSTWPSYVRAQYGI